MRPIVLAVATLVAVAACSSSNDLTSPNWVMRACDQARIDLATAKGQPTTRVADASDPRLETREVWTYVALTPTTRTTDVYTFTWPAGASATASCQQMHTATTAAR